ncbi:MAG: arginine--tRNA ligase, partial [Candidatus Levybacteria bacterium]|nr:arginine--tRNA ligase [Candidatus Levybacteria bacterium]
MSSIKETISTSLKKALQDLGIEGVEPQVEAPADSSHGDYASNIALAIFSSSKFKVLASRRSGQSSKFRSPLELAKEIASIIHDSSFIILSKVEAVPPGFINFWLSKDYLVAELEKVLAEKESYGKISRLRNSFGEPRKIMLEFADPNPFKEFHIGHLRNITLGESFARLLEAQNAVLWRVDYQGDVGMHVAKALYGLLQISKLKSQNSNLTLENKKQIQDIINELDKRTLKEKVKILGQAYAAGSKAYEEDETAKKEIQSINIKVYQMDESVKNLWAAGRQWSLEHFEQIYRRVGTKYKHYYFESAISPLGKELVVNNVQKGIFEASEGAIVFRGEKVGLHTRVFVTKENYPTYEAKDLALAKAKYEDVKYDKSIVITAHEQAIYFQVVLAALKLLFPDLAAKTVHYSFGFVRLKEGKMSSRTGNVITGDWLLDEAKRRIKESFKEMDEETAEKVAVGAVKYSMLKFAPASDISFSFEESISLEGNSGPYIQYTYARTQSVLRKARDKNDNTSLKRRRLLRLEAEEEVLLRLIVKFPEVVEEAGEGFAP